MGHFVYGAVFQYGFHHGVINLAVAQVLGNGLTHVLYGGIAIVVLQVILYKVIGQLIGVGHNDLVDGHGKDGILAGKLGVALIGVGEGHFDIEGLAGLVADELLQEVVNVAGHADGHLGAGAIGAAALKFHTVHLAHIVDVDGIAIRYLAVGNLFLIGVAGHNGIDLLLDVLFLYGHSALVILDAGILAQRHIVLGGNAIKPAVSGQPQAVVYGGVAVALLAAAGGQAYAQHQRHQHGQYFYKLIHFASSKLAAVRFRRRNIVPYYSGFCRACLPNCQNLYSRFIIFYRI